MKYKMQILGVLFAFIALLSSKSLASDNSCSDLIKKNEVKVMTQAEAHRLRLARIYKDFAEQLQEIEFKFGFESEYTLNNYASKLLNYYGPSEKMGLSPAVWHSMKPAEKAKEDLRVEWIKKNLDQLFGSKKSLGHVVLLNPDFAPKYMPRELILDYTGNLEIILQPADSFEEWRNRVTWIITNIGAGSMQSTIGIPKKHLFNVTDKNAALRSNVGYFQFMADLDALMKLMQGYEKYLEEPQKPAASAFQHPFLGPLSNLKRKYLDRIFADNLVGKSWDKETLEKIGFNDDSFKYIGSTSYRPDLGGKDYVVLEVRDAHSNYEVLYEKLTRAMYYFSRSRESFAPFYDVQAFDSVDGFAALPMPVRTVLMQLFPQKPLEEGDVYNEDEIIANQVYRNFAYPMRDWTKYLHIMGYGYKTSQVMLAQTNYLRTLQSVAQQLSSGEIDAKAASLLIQGALAKFSVESGLLNIMLEWLEIKTLGLQQAASIFQIPYDRLSA